LPAGGLEVGDVAGARIEPAERRHDVLARLEDAHDLLAVGDDRGVEDAVGLLREERLRVVRGDDAEAAEPAELAGVAAGLPAAGHPAAAERELGWRDDALERGAADAAGPPRDHAIAHPLPPRRPRARARGGLLLLLRTRLPGADQRERILGLLRVVEGSRR